MDIARGRLKTAEGLMEYAAPQIAGRDEPFRSAIREHLKGHTQGLEELAIASLARGLSVRDIEDALFSPEPFTANLAPCHCIDTWCLRGRSFAGGASPETGPLP